MISKEEVNYNNQMSLLTSLYKREVLDAGATEEFYVPLFEGHSLEITRCYKVLYSRIEKPEYHAGYVETVYRALMTLHGLTYETTDISYIGLDQLESDSKLYRK
jgi:hypothetical protein